MKFNFSIGGFMGESFRLWIEDHFLHCEVFGDHHSERVRNAMVQIANNAAWNEMMAYLATRKWKSEYVMEGVMDGTGWELSVVSDHIQIQSSGSNAYPPGFRKFLKLLNEVLKDECIEVY